MYIIRSIYVVHRIFLFRWQCNSFRYRCQTHCQVLLQVVFSRWLEAEQRIRCLVTSSHKYLQIMLPILFLLLLILMITVLMFVDVYVPPSYSSKVEPRPPGSQCWKDGSGWTVRWSSLMFSRVSIGQNSPRMDPSNLFQRSGWGIQGSNSSTQSSSH